MQNSFKENTTLSERIKESSIILSKYRNRVPIIVEKHETCDLPMIEKYKYLSPKDLTIAQFMFIIRKHIKLESSQTLFITINNELVNSSQKISDIYSDYKDKDGFLCIVYTSENTFG